MEFLEGVWKSNLSKRWGCSITWGGWLGGMAEKSRSPRKEKPYLKLVAHPEGRIEDAPQKPIPVDLPGAKVWISPEYFEEDMDIIEAFEGKYSDDSLFEPFLTHPEAGDGKLNDTTGSPQAD